MSKSWFSDIQFEDSGSVLVKKTGHRFRLHLGLANDVFTWMTFYFFAQMWRFGRRITGHKHPVIAFTPDIPRPWYLIWPVLHVAGGRITNDMEKADIVMQFDDTTETQNDLPDVGDRVRTINFKCDDISKSRISRAFATVAGYDLEVDPTIYDGPIVEKSEINGAHDGRIIVGPITRQPGMSYQRLIDNSTNRGLVQDFRTVTVNGEPVVVFIKRRPLARRFQNENCEVVMKAPSEVFTQDELDVIRRFTKEIHLDWGGVDVLRDAADGRIYIVDANKTDMGPPFALPLGQKLKSTRRLARAFAEQFAS